tara:strand:- start:2891 stop:3706 length:816 start_codon:yes stop_codon:yes gene_type:complete
MSISFHISDNYKAKLKYSTAEIFVKYKGIIEEYLVQCVESISISNVQYHRYILCKGIETISHVFRILLLHTNNLELTYHHCQKAFYYYVEFIDQIGNETHTFLQLNSKDASLFVYKKTIYEIQNEYSRARTNEFQQEQPVEETRTIILNNVERLIGIYNRSIYDIVNTNMVDINLIKIVDVKINKFVQHLLNLSLVDKEADYEEALKIVEQLDEKLNKLGCKRIQILEIFARKIKDKSITNELLRMRFYHVEHDNMLDNLSALRYVNWLFS